MANLEDFTNGGSDIDSFMIDESERERLKISNKQSNTNLAAYVASAAAGPEDLEAVYRELSSELETEQYYEESSLNHLLSLARSNNHEAAKRGLIDFLANPDIPDEQKRDAIEGTMNLDSEMYNIRNSLSYQALEQDSGVENSESEFVRLSMGEIITDLNEYKAQEQALLNSAIAETDFNMIGAYGDIIEFFLPFVDAKYTADVSTGIKNGDSASFRKAFALMGSAKKDIREMVRSIPVEDRLDFTEKVIEAVNQHSGIAISDENGYARMHMLRSVLEDGYYTDFDVWIENVVSILDTTLIGGVMARAGKGLVRAAARPMARLGIDVSSARDAFRRSVTHRVQPTSVSQNLKDVNPDKARAVHDLVASDMTEEAAQALYGTSRTEAIANDILPEVATQSGSVRAKVSNMAEHNSLRTTPPAEIKDFVKTTGARYFWQEEKAAMASRVVEDFAQAQGMRVRSEMSQVDTHAAGVTIRNYYGPTKSGFSSPEDAMNMAEWAFRDYGVTRDNLTLMVRSGGDYVPTTLDDIASIGARSELAQKLARNKGRKSQKLRESAAKAGLFRARQPDYLVRLDFDYRYNPADVTEWMQADVKYNIFDRFVPFLTGGHRRSGATTGSLQEMVVDAASSLHPNIVMPAFVAVDKSAELERKFVTMAKGFADGLYSLPRDRRAVMDDLIKRANFEGRSYSSTELTAMGLTPSEIKVWRDWREVWDTLYWVENRDAAITFRNQGWQEYIDKETNTNLIARPVRTRQAAGSSARVYSQADDSIVTLGRQELDELYESGGYLARTKDTINMGDDVAEFVAVANRPGDNYLRGITENTKILNYREGYYSVQYTNPQFVEKIVRNNKGEELYRQAVSTAPTARDARTMRDRLRSTDQNVNVEYVVRPDVKRGPMDFDTYWDLQKARGRSAQKIRGERLSDSTSLAMDPSQTPIMSPVDSLIMSIRSTSERASMRELLDTHKTRMINQYEDLFPLHPKTKEPVFPSSRDQIQYRGVGDHDGRRIADAQTSWGYINYLENGYINSIDDGYKYMLRRISDIAGDHNFTSIERAFNWAADSRGPSAMVRNAAFQAYLATNPQRQLLIQGSQALQLGANFGGWMVSKKSGPQVIALITQQLGQKPNRALLDALDMTEEQATKMYRDWRNSGLSASVDKQALVRGALLDLADEAARKDIKVLTVLRKVGYDAGENFSMMTAWLAHRDQAIRQGKNLADESVLDEISGLARNYTFGMNRAGDMAYNQNALSAIFQFQVVPHKAMMLSTFNRMITPQQKLRLFGFNAVMFTLPAAGMLALFSSILPEEGVARDLALNGLMGATFNKLLSVTTGEETYLDWSAFSPMDMYGTYDFIHALFTLDVGTMVAESPSGQLLFGGNSRLTDFAKTASRFTNLVDDYEDPTEFTHVVDSFLSMSSGYSNMMRARYALQVGKKINALGVTTDEEVTTMEAIMTGIGLRTMDEVQRVWIGQAAYERSQEFEDDVNSWYRDTRRHLTRTGMSNDEVEMYLKISSEAWRVWGNDNKRAKQIVESNLRRDMQDGDVRMYNLMMRMYDIQSLEETKGMINALPDVSTERKHDMIEALEFMDQYRDDE